jgi:hypothetical protein
MGSITHATSETTETNLKTQRFVQRALQFLVKKKSISVSTAILSFL